MSFFLILSVFFLSFTCNGTAYPSQVSLWIHKTKLNCKLRGKQLTTLWQSLISKDLPLGALDELENGLDTVIRNGPVSTKERVFIINGWRWHTSSAINDLKKFAKKIRREKKSSQSCLLKCYDFVYGFNCQSLLRVESELFFPWLQTMLPSALRSYLDDAYGRHITIRQYSKLIIIKIIMKP